MIQTNEKTDGRPGKPPRVIFQFGGKYLYET
jgi:hypothetical protein